MRIDASVVSPAAVRLLDASVVLTEGWQGAAEPLLRMPRNAAGEVEQAWDLAAQQSACADAAARACEAMVAALESASEAMHECVRRFSALDDETAERLRQR